MPWRKFRACRRAEDSGQLVAVAVIQAFDSATADGSPTIDRLAANVPLASVVDNRRAEQRLALAVAGGIGREAAEKLDQERRCSAGCSSRVIEPSSR